MLLIATDTPHRHATDSIGAGLIVGGLSVPLSVVVGAHCGGLLVLSVVVGG